MKKNIIISNYLFNLIYQIVIIITPIITTPYISRIIGVEGIGIYSYCLSISTYFIVIGMLGIPIYAKRQVAYKRRDIYERSKIFFEIFTCQTILLLASLMLFLMLFVIRKNSYSMMFAMVSIGIVASIFDISWFLVGLEEFKLLVSRNLFIKLTSISMIFTLVKSNNDLYKYAFYIMLANLLGNISLWIYIPNKVKKVSFNKLEFKKHIKPAIILMLPHSVSTIYAVINKSILGSLTNSMLEVGLYEQSQKIIMFTTTIATSFGAVLMPRLAVLFCENNNEEIKIYINYAIKFICFITIPIMFGIIAISDNLVPWFFGEGFQKVSILIKIFSPLAFIIGLSNLLGTQYLIAIKKEKILTKIILIGTIINCIFNVMLIPSLKSEGAALATIIGESIILLILIYVNRKVVEGNTILTCIRKYLFVSFIMYLAIKYVEKYFNIPESVIGTIVLTIIGLIVYIILLLIKRDEILVKILRSAINKINNFNIMYRIKNYFNKLLNE